MSSMEGLQIAPKDLWCRASSGRFFNSKKRTFCSTTDQHCHEKGATTSKIGLWKIHVCVEALLPVRNQNHLSPLRYKNKINWSHWARVRSLVLFETEQERVCKWKCWHNNQPYSREGEPEEVTARDEWEKERAREQRWQLSDYNG